MDKKQTIRKYAAYAVGVMGSIGSYWMLRNISPYKGGVAGEVVMIVAAEFLSIKAGHLIADQFLETWDEIDSAIKGEGPTLIIL